MLIVSITAFLINLCSAQNEIEIDDLDNNGNVGLKITTTNPDSRELNLGFDVITKQAILGTKSQHDMSFYTNDQERLRIRDNGRIGIGTSNPARDMHIDGDGDGSTLLRLERDNGTVTSEIGIELYASGSGPSIVDTDWRIVNRAGGLRFQTALNQNGTFDEVFRMGVSGSNTYSFFQSTMGIGRFPTRTLDVQEDNEDMIARFTQTTEGAVSIELVRQSGTVNTTNRDWQIMNDDTGIFTIGDATNGTNYNTQLRLSPTVFSVDADCRPLQDNTFDLGSSTLRWDDIYATNPVINTSDRREKKDINSLEYGLETLQQLQPVSYYWRDGDPDKKLGLIAQDVYEVIPEVVNVPESEEGLYGITYTELIPVLIQSIKELSAEVNRQKEKIEILESKN